MVLFPLSPPQQGLKIIVWLSRRWGPSLAAGASSSHASKVGA